MNHSIVKFRGTAAIPGLYLTLTRVNREHDYFFSVRQTGNIKAGSIHSPLCSISYQLHNEMFDSPLKERILVKGWRVEDCAFRMWPIGFIDEFSACKGLSFGDLWKLTWILIGLINGHLKKLGHEVATSTWVEPDESNKPLYEIAKILFEEFLSDILPQLLNDFDLDSVRLSPISESEH